MLASNPDNGHGCGLGKLALSDYKHPKNIAPQVMMAKTNGTFGSQTFGISFGTSGCTNDGQVMAARKSMMMGVAVEHQPAFFSLAQDWYRILMERGGRFSARNHQGNPRGGG